MRRRAATLAAAVAILAACEPFTDPLDDGSTIVGYQWHGPECLPPLDPCRYWYAILPADGSPATFGYWTETVEPIT